MRQEIHNPVEVICRIKEFMTIAKLVIIFDDALLAKKEVTYQLPQINVQFKIQ